MKFTSEMKVKDIALSSPAARRVLAEAGLDYCCGGGKPLHEACLYTNRSTDKILDRLRESAKSTDRGDQNWMVVSLCELTRHIREKHHRYVREAIRDMHALLDKVTGKHGKNHNELLKIARLFAEVGNEMMTHMQKEEMVLFPYIDGLERSVNAHKSIEPPFFQTVRNPIHTMMKEHDAAGELLKKIRSLSSGYAAPADACTSFRALYEALREFEADLHEHVHLENNVLFPRAVEIEGAAT